MPTPSAIPSPKPPTAPSASRRCSRPRCGSTTTARSACCRCSKAMTINPAKLLGLPSGRLEKGAPADLILVDLGQPWVVDKAQLGSALQELALRREQDAGPRARDHGCRRTPSTNTLAPSAADARAALEALADGASVLGLRAAGASCRLSAGLDSVRPAADQGRRPRRRAQHRLRQHRRHQRAAHRPQGPGRRHAAARCAQGHRRGAARLRGRQALRRLRRLSSSAYSRASAPSSAISFRCGCASRAARASPPTSAC